MKLHEYQAKRLFGGYDILVPHGLTAATPLQAAQAYRRLNTLCRGGARFACNVKAQLTPVGAAKPAGS